MLYIYYMWYIWEVFNVFLRGTSPRRDPKVPQGSVSRSAPGRPRIKNDLTATQRHDVAPAVTASTTQVTEIIWDYCNIYEQIYEIIYNSITYQYLSVIYQTYLETGCTKKILSALCSDFFFALFRFPGSSPGMPPGTVRALWASLLQRWHDENDPGMLDFNGFHHDWNLVGGLEPWY